jgi:hypothetical protein
VFGENKKKRMNISTRDYAQLSQIGVDGSDAQVVAALRSLAGGQPSREAEKRWRESTVQQRRNELLTVVWDLAKEDSFIVR